MRLSRAVVFAVLAYVSFDLAIPTVPGAFVFSAADSIESLQAQRARPAAGMAVVAPVIYSVTVSRPPVQGEDRFVLTGAARPLGRRVVSILPRGALDPVPSSDDH